MTAQQALAAELLGLDEPALYRQLGYQYGRSGAAAGAYRDTPQNPEVEQMKGERLMDEMQPLLVQKLCKEWDACSRVRNGQFASVEELVVVVADLLSTVLLGVPVLIVAVLVVKIGIRNYCDCV